mgnify:CR=1 FL=1
MDTWHELKEQLEGAVRDLSGLSDDTRTQLRDDMQHLRRIVVAPRTPRIAVVGKANVGMQSLLASFGASVADWDVREALGQGRWYDHVTPHGPLRIADLRDEAGGCARPLEYEQPDLLLAVARSEDEDVAAVADALIAALDCADDVWGDYPPAIVAVFRADGGRSAGDFKTIQALKDAFAARGLSRDFVEVVAASRSEKLAGAIVAQAPDDIKLTLVRMTDDRAAKQALAEEVVRIASSVSAAIATIPIPMADIVPITTAQMTMIAAVAYVSGRPVNLRTIGEFLAAVGLNVGAGMALRSMVRALARLIPFAGPVVSATVAAAATRTLGNAAIRHFIR